MLEFKNPRARAWLATRQATLTKAQTVDANLAEMLFRLRRGEFQDVPDFDNYRRMDSSVTAL